MGRIRFGKVFFLEKGSFQKSLDRDSRELEILEIWENPQTVENKGEFDRFLEILENSEILEILEIPPVKRPFVMTPFSVPDGKLKKGFSEGFSVLRPQNWSRLQPHY